MNQDLRGACVICGGRAASDNAMDSDDGVGLVRYSLCAKHWSRYQDLSDGSIIHEVESAIASILRAVVR